MSDNPFKQQILESEQLIQEERYDEALRQIRKILEKDPDNIEALNDAGVTALNLQESEKAISYLSHALNLDPGNLNVFYNLLDSYLSEKDFESACELFTKYQDKLPESREKDYYYSIFFTGENGKSNTQNFDTKYDAQIEEGEQLFLDGEVEAASQIFRDIIEKDPFNINALNNLGVISVLQEKYSEGVEYFLKGLQRNPSNHDIISNLLDVSKIDEGKTKLEKQCEHLINQKILSLHERINLRNLVKILKRDTSYKAAFVTLDITPKLHEVNAHNLHNYEDISQSVENIQTPLYLQMLLIEDQRHNKLLFVSADIFGFNDSMVKKIRDFARTGGIPPEGIILNSSHTHYVPGKIDNNGDSTGPHKQEYEDRIVNAVKQLFIKLYDNLEDCFIYSGQAEARIGAKWRKKENGYEGFEINEDGYYDSNAPVLLFEFVKSPRKIAIVNHGCVPTNLSEQHTLSAGYPAYMREFLENTSDVADVMFLQGAAGTIQGTLEKNGITGFTGNTEDVVKNGQSLAMAINTTISGQLNILDGNILATSELVDLPMLSHVGSDIDSSLPIEISVLSLAEHVHFVSLPGEPASELAPKIRKGFETNDNVFILGYTNGLKAFFPTADMLEDGGYEGGVNKLPSQFKPEVEKVLLDGIQKNIGIFKKEIQPNCYGRYHLMKKKGQAFFTLSSGRCGTMTMSHILNTSTNARVYHHPLPYLIDETGQAYNDEINKSKIFWQSRGSLILDAWKDDLVFGELDHNMTPFSPVIAEEIPESKFIVLVRNPWDFVRSGMRRNYYQGHPWDSGRLRPNPIHQDFERWQSMSQFEKVCWLWNETYTKILMYLNEIPEERYKVIRFEDLVNSTDVSYEIFEFLHLEGYSEEKIKQIFNTPLNKQVTGSYPNPVEWSDEQHGIVRNQCMTTMKSFGYKPTYSAIRKKKTSNEKFQNKTIPTTTIWDFKKFKHQKYPENISSNYFREKSASDKLITSETPIASIGSCFARNVAKYLIQNGYNYLITEKPFQQASAHWEQVYNTASIRQIFEYTFTDRWNPLVRWWPKGEHVQDPFRRNILYSNNTYKEDFQRHKQASFAALSKAEVIIITLGLIETWRDKRDKMTYYRVPSPRIYDSNIHEFYIQTVDDCLKDLHDIYKIVNQHNPDCHLIVTVSPVPLFATFRMDTDVINANMLSKSTLRVAAEYFTHQYENVYYFPSYEIVMQGVQKPFEDDNRHVTKETIAEVMGVFEDLFMAD